MKSIQIGIASLLVAAGAVLVGCGTAPQKSSGQTAFEKVADKQGFAVSSAEAGNVTGDEKYKITSVSKVGADGKTEALMLLEKPDGTFQMNSFSVPSGDQVSADAYDTGTKSNLLDENGNLVGSQTLGDIQDGVGANYAWWVYPTLRWVAGELVRRYGRGVFGNGCNWVLNRVRDFTGWGVPSWFQGPACRYMNYLINAGFVELNPQQGVQRLEMAIFERRRLQLLVG